MDFLKLTHDPLSVSEVTELVGDPSCGAISLFVGTTRDNFEGKIVCKLEYEAYNEMATKEMKKICKESRKKWNLQNIAVHHRLGVVGVKEASVILAVSSEHRRESLEAVSFLIDALKASVPIWKREVYADDRSEWKQNKECSWNNSSLPPVLEDGVTIKEEILDEDFTAEDKVGNEILDTAIANEMFDQTVVDEMLGGKIKVQSTSSELQSPEQGLKRKCSSGESSQVLKRIKTEDEELDVKVDAKLVDPHFVQIVASKEEMQRRIKAFQDRKREELNVLNIQEFCVRGAEEREENSCARTTAVVLRSKGSTSHLKYTKVFNEWGPQTVNVDAGSSRALPKSSSSSKEKQSTEGQGESQNPKRKVESFIASPKPPAKRISEGVEERLSNMENHLNVSTPPEELSHASVYSRLKTLEDRILFLEGISPEYFDLTKVKHCRTPIKKEEEKATEDDLSLDEIDAKICALRKKIKEKQLGISL